MSTATEYYFSDFTENGYDRLLDIAKVHYRFEPFGTRCVEQHALWRHDVDISVHRALWCAVSEAKRGVRSTYFFLLHSEFYNLLEYSVLKAVNQILEAGHWLGLHFDPTIYLDCDRLSGLEQRVDDEKRFLERIVGTSVDAVSYHRPTVSNVLDFDQAKIGGLWNAYSRDIKSTYCYMSDSNGYWRFQRVPDVLDGEDRPAKLHLLTHPEWWTREVMSPRKRVIAAIEGRSSYVLDLYDRELKIHGRTNVE